MGAAILYLLGGLIGLVLMVRLIVFLVVASTPSTHRLGSVEDNSPYAAYS
ncbi:MAG: hypothetical protein ACRDMH_03690 [Solirubrobacterales bacterium]